MTPATLSPAAAAAVIAAGGLRLALQPVRPALRTDLVAFEEALARLDGPTGLLAAAAFVPALEAAGGAPLLDRAALVAALEHLEAHQTARVSVNLSAETLGDPTWLARLEAAAPSVVRRLIVELTETRPADPARARAHRARIGAAGAAFALDDFGAGHADADVARALQPDILKLDRALSADRRPHALALARELDAMTVAEGVASAAEALALAAEGVDAVQGLALGVPTLAAA